MYVMEHAHSEAVQWGKAKGEGALSIHLPESLILFLSRGKWEMRTTHGSGPGCESFIRASCSITYIIKVLRM